MRQRGLPALPAVWQPNPVKAMEVMLKLSYLSVRFRPSEPSVEFLKNIGRHKGFMVTHSQIL